MENFIFTVIGYAFWISIIIGEIYIFAMFVKGIIDMFRGKGGDGSISRGDYPDEIYNAFR